MITPIRDMMFRVVCVIHKKRIDPASPGGMAVRM